MSMLAATERTTPQRLGVPALAVHDLTKRYGTFVAVERLSFTLSAGDVLGLLGPNGAGKTTAICALLGLVQPDEGRIEIAGIDARRFPQRALAQVGALVESPTFYPYLSGWENLEILADLRGVPSRWVGEALERVGLAERARQRVSAYSLGMRQRLAIASALLHRPRVLILDEPTNGLDPHGIAEVRALIRTLAGEGHAILLCSHVLAEVEQVCTHVLVLARGRTVARGAIAELLGTTSEALLVSPEPTRAEAALAQLSWVDVCREQGKFRIRIPRGREDEFAMHLLQASVAVRELCWKGQRLEDFFLAATADEATPSRLSSTRRRWLRRRGG